MDLRKIKNGKTERDQKIIIIVSIALFLFLGISLGFNLAFVTQGPGETIREERIETTPLFGPIEGEIKSEEITRLYEEISPSVVLIETGEETGRQGSGFIYKAEGYILTNQHVVEGEEEVRVTFQDGSVEVAEVIGEDVYSDVAVIKIEDTDKELKPIPKGSIENIKPGERVVALGNPFGLEGTITKGIVSQKERLLTTEAGFSIPNVIQTDAAINPGNSGGPLLNLRGEVIGINTAIRTETGAFVGIGFSISINTAERVAEELIEEGEYKHSWIGIRGTTMNPQIAEKMDSDQKTGVLISEVVRDGPAHEAGLREGTRTEKIWGEEVKVGGDIIKEIDGERIRSMDELISYIAQYTEPGQKITLTIEREGEETQIEMELGERPEPQQIN